MAAEAARDELARMPLERIKDVTRGRLMLSAIEEAGCTVGAVLTAGPSVLDTVPGVGRRPRPRWWPPPGRSRPPSPEAVTVRIDPDRRTLPQASLLGALHAYEAAQENVPPGAPDPAPLKGELDAAVARARPAGSRLRMFFSGSGRKQDARDGLARLHAISARPRRPASAALTWVAGLLFSTYRTRPTRQLHRVAVTGVAQHDRHGRLEGQGDFDVLFGSNRGSARRSMLTATYERACPFRSK